VDNTGTTQNTNPIILDSNGQANVWLLNSETYKYILKTPADVTLYTVDYVSVPLTSESFASPPPIGSGTPNAGTFTTLNVINAAIFESTTDFTEPVTFDTTVTLSTTTGLIFNDGSSQNTAATGFGFKNRIINGAMVIDQRNAGASVAPVNAYTLDRWRADSSTASKFSVQQNAGSVTPPAGYANYLGVTTTSAYSVTASDYFALVQNIEGYNINDLAWGTASAASITLSFWVRSSLTGTFGGSLYGGQVYPFTYTISSANTWEQKFITIAGSTSGTWNKTNGIGINVNFGLGVGSTYSAAAGSWGSGFYYSATGATSVVGTFGATFYVTGVQLEKGSTATSFDYRPYGTELMLCQRYYQTTSAYFEGVVSSGSDYAASAYGATQMRATPTVAGTSTSAFNFPSSVGTLNAVDSRSIYNRRRASGTGAGSFTTSITLSAEL
jgi:hypothetical protein